MIPRPSVSRDGRPSRRDHAPAARHRVATAAGAILLLMGLAQGGAACAVAPVAGPSGSATAGTASPLPQNRDTRVVQYSAGHTVITQDHYGTDITVQRTPGGLGTRGVSPGPGRSHGQWQPDPEQRRPEVSAQDQYLPAPSLRDEYRRRMLDRLDRYP